MHILITRPVKQSASTELVLKELGHSCTIEPLLRVEKIEKIDLQEIFSGVLLTSKNAVFALEVSCSKKQRKTLPVLTTGLATAEQLRSAGFANIDHVQGSALDLVDAVPRWVKKYNLKNRETLLYPCAEQTAHDIPALLSPYNIKCLAWPVYRTIPRTEFSKTTLKLLQSRKIDAVLLYSSRTARTFVKLLDDNNLSPSSIKIFALSKEIALSIPKKFSDRISYPTRPVEDDLLALLT